MTKNTASQVVGAQMISASDGSAFTGSVTCSVTIDGGAQATGTVGSGACTHEGNGYHTYAPSQAETNGNLVAFTFTGSGAIPATVQVFTTAWAKSLANVPANVTQFGGSNGTFASGRPEVNASHIAGSSVSTSAAQIGVNVVSAGGTAWATVLTNLVTSIWSATTRLLTAGTNIVLAKGTGVTGFNDLDAAGVRSAVGLASANLDTQIAALPTDADVNAQVDAALADYDAPTKAELDAAVSPLATASALATVDGNVDAILEDTGTTLPGTLSTIDSVVDGIAAKTTNLPTDPADQSLLIAATDSILSRLGSPAGASVSADVAAVKSDTSAILTDTGTTLDGKITTIDSVVDAIKAVTDVLPDSGALSSLATASALATVDTVVDGIAVQTTRVDALIEDSTGDRFTAKALEQAPSGGGSIPTAGEIADAVWDEDLTEHTTEDSAGNTLGNVATGTPPSAAAIRAEIDANSTQLAAIVSDTNELQTDWANGGRLDLILDARASQTSVDDLPTNAELASALASADDAVLAQVALVKAKTDTLPSDPADASVVAGLIAGVDAKVDAIDLVVDAILNDTAAIDGRLPSDPADQSLVIAATNAIVSDTEDIQAKIGTPVSTVSADIAAVKAQAAAIEADTQDLQAQIGTAGAGLTAIGDTRLANLDAAVSTRATPAQVATALTTYDAPTKAELDAAIEALPTANENADALLDRADGIETGVTLRQAHRLQVAAAAGKVSGAGTSTVTIRDLADTKDRLVGTVDEDGNRTAVTRDLD